MNKEELIGKLHMIYAGDRNALEEMVGYYDGLKQGIEELQQENKQLKDKLSKIETLIINHNCDTGDIYYKYNSKFLKSELKQRILEIVYEEGSDNKEELEELAFKDRKELANLNELDLLEIIEFLQLDRKQWINQYSTAHNDYVDLQQENQKYKEVIDKAINYIEKESAFLSDDEYELFNKKELLDILKEVE